MAKPIRAAAVLIIIVGIILLLAEIGLRIYLALAPDPAGSPYVRDEHAGFRLRPTPVENIQPGSEDYINSFGFRDRNHAVEKPRGNYRILGIGDSFVYAVVPPAENFLRIAANNLRPALASRSLDTEMIMMGLGSYSLKNELGLMESLGLELDPDLVILNLFVGNDISGLRTRGKVYLGQMYFEGSHNPILALLRKSRLFLLTEKVFLTRIKAAIIKHRLSKAEEQRPAANNNVEHEIANAEEDTTGSGGADTTKCEEESPAHFMVTHSFLHIQSKRLVVYQRTPDRRLERLWKEAESYLTQFDTVCREAGIPWMLHIIPAEVQVDPAVRSTILDRLGLSEDDHDFDLPQRRLRGFAAENEISCWDPLPDLRKLHRAQARLYVPNDTHWGTRGNMVAGVLLGRFIRTVMLGDTSRVRLPDAETGLSE